MRGFAKSSAITLTLLAFSVSAPAQQQPTGLPTIGFLNGTEFILTQPYTYVIGSTNQSITIPAGFVTDFASIPAPLRSVLDKQDQYSRAAVIHDYLYWTHRCSRRQSDNLLMIAMKETGVGAIKRQAVYRGVRAGGRSAWRSNLSERQAGKPRVVPEELFNLADHNTWQAARATLIERGIRDPAFHMSSAVCALGNSTSVP